MQGAQKLLKWRSRGQAGAEVDEAVPAIAELLQVQELPKRWWRKYPKHRSCAHVGAEEGEAGPTKDEWLQFREFLKN